MVKRFNCSTNYAGSIHSLRNEIRCLSPAAATTLLILSCGFWLSPTALANPVRMPESRIWDYTVKEKRSTTKTYSAPVTPSNSLNRLKTAPQGKNSNGSRSKSKYDLGNNSAAPSTTHPGSKSPRIDLIVQRTNELIEAGNLDLALRIIDHEFTSDAHSEDLAIAKARVLDASNKTDLAVSLIRSFVQNDPSKLKARAFLGNLYFLSGEFTKAHEYLQPLAHSSDVDALTYFRLGQLALLNDDIAMADEFLTLALKLDQRMFEAQFLHARLLSLLGKNELAGKAYARTIELNPDSPLAISEWATLLASTGRTLDAIEKLLQAHRLAPASVDIVQRFIQIYGARQDWPDALDYAKNWVQLEPNNSQAHFICGWCALNLGEYSDAVSFLKKAEKIAPNAATYNLYAMAQYEQRKVEDALYAFKQAESFALKSNDRPQLLIAVLNSAVVLASKSRFEEAQQKLRQTKSIISDWDDQVADENVSAVHSFILALQGQFAKAREIAESVLNERENEPTYAVLALSICDAKTGNSKAAITRLRNLLSAEPISTYVLCLLAQAYLQDGNAVEALEQIQQALQVAPSNLMAKEILARALIARGNHAGAIPLLKEYIARNPKELDVRISLGEVQVLNGEVEPAELTYEKAIKSFPESAAPAIGLSAILWNKGEYAKAEEYATNAVSIEPTNARAHLALAKSLYSQRKISQALNALQFFRGFDNLEVADSVRTEALLLRAKASLKSGELRFALADIQKLNILGASMRADDKLDFASAAIRIGDVSTAAVMLSDLKKQAGQLSNEQQNVLRRLEQKVKRNGANF